MSPDPLSAGTPDSSDTLAGRWNALVDAGRVVARLAGDSDPLGDDVLRGFPAQVRECEDWQRSLAVNAVSDIASMMEPGLAALLAVHARGSDTRPAAGALWAEYCEARQAAFAIVGGVRDAGPSIPA